MGFKRLAFLDDIASHLETQALGVVSQSIFKTGLEPPDAGKGVLERQIAVLLTGGGPPEHTLDGLRVIYQHGLQVLARAEINAMHIALDLAYQAMQVLDAVVNLTIAGSLYQEVRPLQPPFQFDLDRAGRPIAAVNFIAYVDITL